jgi:hypothetical protein
MVKAAPTKSLPRADAAPGASVLFRAGAPSRTVVSKATAAVAAPKAGVLKISTGTKRPSAGSLKMANGKQARVDVMPHKTMV